MIEATLGNFGLRFSAFFRPSDFGFRVCAFALSGWWYSENTPISARRVLEPGLPPNPIPVVQPWGVTLDSTPILVERTRFALIIHAVQADGI